MFLLLRLDLSAPTRIVGPVLNVCGGFLGISRPHPAGYQVIGYALEMTVTVEADDSLVSPPDDNSSNCNYRRRRPQSPADLRFFFLGRKLLEKL